MIEPDRRSTLLAAKLRALVRPRGGGEPEPATFGGGAAGTTAGPDGSIHGWVLVDDDRPRGVLGGALVWAERARVAHLHVLVDDVAARAAVADGAVPTTASALARRASCFSQPLTVWRVEGTELVEVAPGPPEPAPEPRPEALSHVEMIRAAGAVPVVEHGVVVAEVAGLEVARTVVDPDDSVHLEVGVGRHDRLASSMMAGPFAEPTEESLRKVVEMVAVQRADRDVTQPLSNLAPERRLRRHLVDHPGLVGLDWLEVLPPVEPAPSIREPFPAGALGRDPDGDVVVACSSGVDLELVPLAAELRLVHAPAARLVLVVPPGDDHDLTRRLAAALVAPAEVRVVDVRAG